MSEQRRTNVAVTRARRHLAVVGDSETVSHEPFLRGMIEYCHQEGEVWSAQEYCEGTWTTFEFRSVKQRLVLVLIAPHVRVHRGVK